MKENELGVADRYDLTIHNTRRVRDAILCETDKGLFLLKELAFSEKKIPDLCRLYDYMAERGYTDLDCIMPNKDAEYVSVGEDEKKYYLKKWFYGRESDSKKENDILDGVRNLACLHHAMKHMETEQSYKRENLESELCRHNRELKKVRSFMRNKTTKGAFEIQFLESFEAMYEWAEYAAEQCKGLRLPELEDCIVHGDYNYHNLIVLQNRIATTGFEHSYTGVQLDDMYYYLRKIMEKNQWNIRLGYRMLDQYHRILPIPDEGLEYLATRVAYPEKYWKLANTYNRTNKSWISAKTVEKLNLAVIQTKEKREFLRQLFSFSITN